MQVTWNPNTCCHAGVCVKSLPDVFKLESYVTDDKVYCVYITPDEATVKSHAEQGGFPANKISQILTIIDPTTAES
jgi:uncharacterized Fe-S cluster protein YjdI